ncbi:MAG: cupin domain-containing protein [Pseudomonadota bacterium]
MEPYRILFDDLEWQNGIPGARFKVHRELGKQLRLLELTGAFVEPDWCEKGHVGVVLSGELEIDFRGRCVQYPAGAALVIPAGVQHGHKARSVTPTVRLFLVEEI